MDLLIHLLLSISFEKDKKIKTVHGKNKPGIILQQLKIYKMLRIRMKISYFAWKKGISIKQLLYEQIKSSFLKLYLTPNMIPLTSS